MTTDRRQHPRLKTSGGDPNRHGRGLWSAHNTSIPASLTGHTVRGRSQGLAWTASRTTSRVPLALADTLFLGR